MQPTGRRPASEVVAAHHACWSYRPSKVESLHELVLASIDIDDVDTALALAEVAATLPDTDTTFLLDRDLFDHRIPLLRAALHLRVGDPSFGRRLAQARGARTRTRSLDAVAMRWDPTDLGERSARWTPGEVARLDAHRAAVAHAAEAGWEAVVVIGTGAYALHRRLYPLVLDLFAGARMPLEDAFVLLCSLIDVHAADVPLRGPVPAPPHHRRGRPCGRRSALLRAPSRPVRLT